ncbi:MAG: hypothetical protein RIT26_204 [Pseudomonadota bacterium]|jgi:hypothetical protein
MEALGAPMKKVLYCDFFLDAPQIGSQIEAFLRELARLSGWNCLFVQAGRVRENDRDLGPAPKGDWLAGLGAALDLSHADLVFVWFDDLLPQQPDMAALADLLTQAEGLMTTQDPQGAAYVRLNSKPPSLGPCVTHGFRVITPQEAYRCSLPASVWQADYLRQQMKSSPSCWALESLPHMRLALSASRIHLPYDNLMWRGQWSTQALWRHRMGPPMGIRAWGRLLAVSLKFRVTHRLQAAWPWLYHLILRGLFKR